MAGTRDRRQLEQLHGENRRLRAEANELRARNARLRRASLDHATENGAAPAGSADPELQALRRSEARYRSLLLASTSVVWTRNAVGEFAEPQSSWEAFTGQPWEAHRGRGWLDAYHPDDRERVAAEWDQAMSTRGMVQFEARAWHAPTAAYRYVVARAVPIVDQFGSVVEWVGTLTDIDDRHRLEDALRAAIHARDEFLSIAAHELRTPITSLRGYAQLELRRLQADDRPLAVRVRSTLDVIVNQSDRLTRLVSELLDVARLETGRLDLRREPVDLVSLVRELASTAQATTANHRFVLDLPDSAVVQADSLRVGQVVINLISNAVKYSPEGGDVEVSIAQVGQIIRLAVRDHGLGVPLEHRDRIFERFYQVRTGQRGASPQLAAGMGLGLYISRHIVDLHGGSIHAEFPDDGGSRFVVDLPAPA